MLQNKWRGNFQGMAPHLNFFSQLFSILQICVLYPVFPVSSLLSNLTFPMNSLIQIMFLGKIYKTISHKNRRNNPCNSLTKTGKVSNSNRLSIPDTLFLNLTDPVSEKFSLWPLSEWLFETLYWRICPVWVKNASVYFNYLWILIR